MHAKHVKPKQMKVYLSVAIAIFAIALAVVVVPMIAGNASAANVVGEEVTQEATKDMIISEVDQLDNPTQPVVEDKVGTNAPIEITDINFTIDTSKIIIPYTGDEYNFSKIIEDYVSIDDADCAAAITTNPENINFDMAGHFRKCVMLREDKSGIEEDPTVTSYIKGRSFGLFFTFETFSSSQFIFSENVNITTSAGNVAYVKHYDEHPNYLDVYIEFGTVSDKEHTHTMSLFPAEPATQKVAGHKAYFQCTDCKKYFEDEAGATEITNLEEWLAGPGKTEDSWEVQFTNHKNVKIAALKAMKKDGDSQAVTSMIDKAIKDIEESAYNPDFTLEQNKAAIDLMVEETKTAVDKQRAEDEKKKQEESQGSDTENGSAQTGDMTYVVVGSLMLCALGAGVLAIRKRREF